jgi:hypothetical protein
MEIGKKCEREKARGRRVSTRRPRARVTLPRVISADASHFPPTGRAAPRSPGAGTRGAFGWVGTLAGGMRSGGGSSFAGGPRPPPPGSSGTDVPGISVTGPVPAGPDTTMPGDGSKHESVRHPLPDPDPVPEHRLNHG